MSKARGLSTAVQGSAMLLVFAVLLSFPAHAAECDLNKIMRTGDRVFYHGRGAEWQQFVVRQLEL